MVIIIFSILILLIFSITTTIFVIVLQYYFTAVLISYSYLVNSTKQCCCLIFSIWVHILTHPIKRNGYMLGPLVEHRVDSQILSTLTVLTATTIETELTKFARFSLPIDFRENGVDLQGVICSSSNTPQSHISSCVQAYIAWSLLCMEDVDTVFCSLDCHAVHPPAAKTMHPVVDLRVNISPAQVASVKTCMSKALPLNLMPFATASRCATAEVWKPSSRLEMAILKDIKYSE